MASPILPHPDSYLMGHCFSTPLYCIYVDCSSLNESEQIHLHAQIAGLLPEAESFFEGPGLGVYFHSEPQELQEILAVLSSVIGPLPAGLSGPFASRQNAMGCCKKAMRACGEPGITRFSKVRFSMLREASIASVSRQGFVCTDFLHKDFLRILRYDQKHNTDYAHSLQAYLCCGKNLKEAAGMLGLHRNTLNYRVDRIVDIFSLDLEDMALCFELLFSAKLYFAAPCPLPEDPEPPLSSLGEALTRALWQLLGKESLNADLMEPFQKASGSWYLLSIDTEELDEEVQDQLCQRLTEVPSVQACACNGVMLLAVAAGENRSRCEFLLSAGQLAGEFGCSFVVGQPFFDLTRLEKQLELVKTVRAAGVMFHTGLPVYLSENYMSYAYFMLAQNLVSLQDYHCDDVIRVMDYDYDNSTDLSKSLYVYLSHFMNMKQAADELFVHRNTLEYHIRKIEQMLSADVADKDLRFEMLCTYRMLAIENL